MIMHILHRVSLSLPQTVVLDVIMDLGYADYIRAQSALGELVEYGLVSEHNTYHRTYLTLTESGEETRRVFEKELSPDIRREIDEYLKKNHIETRDITALVSDYRKTPDGMYEATCAIRDGAHTLYQVTMEVSTERDAIRVCDAWESQSQALYSETLKTLLAPVHTEKENEPPEQTD